jgi:hypothetical protein
MKTFFDGQIEVRPSLAQSPADQVGQHHHQHMTAGMFGGANVDELAAMLAALAV